MFATAADLCAAEWHICQSVTEVDEELAGQPCSLSLPGFFASQQATVGNSTCTADRFGANDVAGCANDTSQANTFPALLCGAMTSLVGNDCLDGWTCGNSRAESLELVHSGADGGVLCCQDDAPGRGCGANITITLTADADAVLDVMNPSRSRGNSPAMVVQHGTFESLARFTDDRLADAAIMNATLTLPVTLPVTNGAGTVEVSTTTSDWTEFRDDCRVVGGADTVNGCDDTADGVSWAGPGPSTDGSEFQSPWPVDTTGGGPPLRAALATAVVTSAGAVADVDTMAPMFSGIEGGDVNPLRLTLRLRGLTDTGELTLGTREGGQPATLTLQRCVNR